MIKKASICLLPLIFLIGCGGGPKIVEMSDPTQKHTKRFYLELKKWPEPQRLRFLDETIEVLDTEKCVSPAPAFAECHTFVTYNDKDVLKLREKGQPQPIKMVLTYNKAKDTITIETFRWNGKKLIKAKNSTEKFGPKLLSEMIILWSFR
jgi:hypothetical protein